MGLQINATEKQAILIKGTEVELPYVYARLEMVARADGKTMEVYVSTFASKDAYKEGGAVLTDVPQGSFTVEVEEGEAQSIEIAHKYAVQVFTEKGYKVENV